jgi:hypothetical protein
VACWECATTGASTASDSRVCLDDDRRPLAAMTGYGILNV